jgi:hypothetical protein
MKPVYQNDFGEITANCLSACVASILELPIEDVPTFVGHEDDDAMWMVRLNDWLRHYGYWAIHLDRQTFDMKQYENIDAYTIGTGESGRGYHAVVCKGTEFVFDPHPGYNGLLGEPDSYIVFVAINPALKAA